MNMYIIRRLLNNYFDIVKTKLIDYVPKAISFMFIGKVKEQLQSVIVEELFNEKSITDMLAVSEKCLMMR